MFIEQKKPLKVFGPGTWCTKKPVGYQFIINYLITNFRINKIYYNFKTELLTLFHLHVSFSFYFAICFALPRNYVNNFQFKFCKIKLTSFDLIQHYKKHKYKPCNELKDKSKLIGNF